ncbi:MAG: winged helix-turn-helix transcriptional regulator [Nitrospinae bacterium]|nr:winged helix-turn-helix transcriptional regulator [Nitrospinota bacterium]
MAKDNLNDVLFAFSEEIRLRILMLLSHGSMICVKCIVGTLGVPQPTISRHLALLRRTGIVEVKKDKQHCYYSLRKDGPMLSLKNALVDVFQGALKDKDPFKKDWAKLNKVGSLCVEDCKIRPVKAA